MYKVVVWIQPKIYELLQDGQLGKPLSNDGPMPFEFQKIMSSSEDADSIKKECLKACVEALKSKQNDEKG